MTITKRVIALKRKNRLESFYSRKSARHFQVFWGADGFEEDLDNEFDTQRHSSHYNWEPRAGVVGAAISHARVICTFAKGEGDASDTLVVAEDDALISDFFDEVLAATFSIRHNGFVNFSHLSAGERRPNFRSRTELERQISLLSRPILAGKGLRKRLFRAGPYAGILWGAGLYSISRGAARTFMNYIEDENRVYWVADDFNLFWREMGIPSLVVKPGLCSFYGDSVINEADESFMDNWHAVKVTTVREFLAPSARISKVHLIGEATVAHLRAARGPQRSDGLE